MPTKELEKADNQLGYIPDIKAENMFKTLNLDESLIFLPSEINIWNKYSCIDIQKVKWYYRILYTHRYIKKTGFRKTLLEAVEDVLEKLLDVWYDFTYKKLKWIKDNSIKK